ncbi:MAG: trigger factor [Acidobacteria bacterium]|nr:trigger factor [Acidobacteriota bacterium]
MKLEVAVADISQSRKDLTIEVAAEEVKAEFEKTYDAYSRYAKVPGFRPGRVPRGVVKQRFARDVREEVIGRLLPHALQHAIIDHKLHVVGEPSIDDIDVNDGGPLKFKASVEVIPEFELQDYKGLKLTRKVAGVTDQDVDQVLDRWRQSSAEFVPVEDRPSQTGDFVSVNLVGKFVESPEAEDVTADDVRIELGSEWVQPEFNEHLTGVKADDVREFRVVYPDDFDSKGLAGKTLDFTATVVSVRQKELPELDDDFAIERGEYKSLQEMRDKVRQDLISHAERDADSRLRADLVEQIIGPYDFEIPSSLVEQQATDRTRELAYMMMRNGMSPQSIRQMNWDDRLNEARGIAVKDVRAALVVSRIGDAENIEVSASEVDAEIDNMAASSGESPVDLKARLTKDEALSSIENRLRYQKVLDVVLNAAEISTEELVVESPAEEAAESAVSEMAPSEES